MPKKKPTEPTPRRGRPPSPDGQSRQMIRTSPPRWARYAAAAKAGGFRSAGAWLQALGDAAIGYDAKHASASPKAGAK